MVDEDELSPVSEIGSFPTISDDHQVTCNVQTEHIPN